MRKYEFFTSLLCPTRQVNRQKDWKMEMAVRLNSLISKISTFKSDDAGGSTVQIALMFGAVAMALSVLVAPQVRNAVDIYAENKALGIDRVMTGSIKPTKEYTIRKSVLDK